MEIDFFLISVPSLLIKKDGVILDSLELCCADCYRKGIYMDRLKALHGSMGVKTREENFK